jgi:hypothetical protein
MSIIVQLSDAPVVDAADAAVVATAPHARTQPVHLVGLKPQVGRAAETIAQAEIDTRHVLIERRQAARSDTPSPAPMVPALESLPNNRFVYIATHVNPVHFASVQVPNGLFAIARILSTVSRSDTLTKSMSAEP